ncbi:MAG: HD domain-containing phosphohydrolase, partial [bacterium]
FLGMISLGRKFDNTEFKEIDFELLSTISGNVSMAIYNHNLIDNLKAVNQLLKEHINENKKLFNELHALNHDTIKALAKAIDANDSYTHGHSERVADYSVAIASELNLSDQEKEGLRITGYLHDIGKIGVNINIIQKSGKLTDEEYAIIKRHPITSYEILSNIKFQYPVAMIARYHHECYNGRGYPDGIRGEDLPLGAKIIAVADSVDAMTSDRAYRKGMSIDKVLPELLRCSGTQFDPQVVLAFMLAFKKDLLEKKENPLIIKSLTDKYDPKTVLDLLDESINNSRQLINNYQKDNEVEKDNEVQEYNFTMPIRAQTELVAVQAVEQIISTMDFDQKARDEIRLALIEACINAFEHSKSMSKLIHLTVKVEEGRLTTIVQDQGRGFNPEDVTSPDIDEKLKSGNKRGWGLMLMKHLMDEVFLDSNKQNGTRVTMVKYTNKNKNG